MFKEDKELAEKVLKQMFIGSFFEGIKFNQFKEITRLFFMHYNDNREPECIWLNIESEFKVCTDNYKSPSNLDAEEMQLIQLFSIRTKKVTDIKLGDDSPHLHIMFESGEIINVYGYHKKFESWQAGDQPGGFGEWLVVAIPGNEISIFVPKSFEEILKKM
jgi:hypothetical protein